MSNTNKSTSVYADAEEFTNRIIYLTKNDMVPNTFSQELSHLAKNVIRIMNLDVEDRMEILQVPSGKKIMILFAKDTEYGRYSVYSRDRFICENTKIDVVVLPNAQLLNNLKNRDILNGLEYIYAFILETKKASAEYISPFEIFKHIYAKYFFKVKYFVNSFELDEKTVEDLKLDVSEGSDDLVIYDSIINRISDGEDTYFIFDQDNVFEDFDTEIYYRIIDELSGAYDDEYEETTEA